MMELSITLFLIFLGVGVVAGFVAGFVGVGGGIIMVPVLLEIFRRAGLPEEVVVQAAMATSLSVAVFSVGSSIIRHNRQGRIRWKLVRLLAPGSILGGWMAAYLATRLPGQWLLWSLAVLMLFAALRMIRSSDGPIGGEKSPSVWKVGVTGLGVGLVAGMSGLAGGVVLVPALGLILGVPGSWLAGTSSGTIIFSAMAAAAGYLMANPPLVMGTGFFGYVYLPLTLSLAIGAVPAAQAGAWVNRRVHGNLFRKLFGLLLLIVVARLLLTN
jgi:uncharacterized protein